ncbi:MAG: methyltransferase domain-containing protein [Candidatus Hydrogenedens sp.]|nr:methyltransferase domain-containing protein [Candidatus Hydrogenedens sp.]
MTTTLNDEVRAFWERQPCGTQKEFTGALERGSKAWFEQVEEHRYRVEPFIHGVAQFTRHTGKTMLEIGVGAGTDHLQWARAGCRCHGVDLTDAAIETTRRRLDLYGLRSDLRRLDAETLPFPAASFDLVYSWGVIHHSERPERIIAEIHRVLKPGGRFIGMMYNLWSVAVLKQWVRHGLLAGRPWRSLDDLVWHHIESIGTKAYSRPALHRLFAAFERVETRSLITPYDRYRFPGWLASQFPDPWGFFTAIDAVKRASAS